ncbi:MAG: glycosyltransferase family 2 protein [Rhodanobacter sp.]|nr:MAG: glycosyltransferase family 2 protein [Rhodanobacter sp.]
MTNTRISVALCTYNGAAFLPEQLDSLLRQTRLPDEIVIGDDGSTDGSLGIVEAFARKALEAGVQMKVVRQPANVGYVRNFSDMLLRASGEIVFLCDQDDCWRADKLALMTGRFDCEPDLLLLCSDARLVDADSHDLGVTQFDALELDTTERVAVHAGRAFEVLLRRSMVTGATAAVRRSVLGACLPVGQNWIHDEWLAIVVAAIGRLDVVEQTLIDYRQHASNQVGMRKRTLRDKWRDLVCARQQQFRAEVVRMQVLERHLASLGDQVGDKDLASLACRRRHFETRVAMGVLARWRRMPAIWREARVGNYARFGTGVRSILRDLLRHG